MGRFDGSLRMEGEGDSGLDVVIDLENERMLIRTEHTVLGEWSMSDVGIHSENDGFHLRIEGEKVVMTTSDDAAFALEVGLRSASPRLRRLMASRRDS